MATKLTIWIDDYSSEEMEEWEIDPASSAVSNLQYDGFNVLEWDIDFGVRYPPKEN